MNRAVCRNKDSIKIPNVLRKFYQGNKYYINAILGVVVIAIIMKIEGGHPHLLETMAAFLVALLQALLLVDLYVFIVSGIKYRILQYLLSAIFLLYHLYYMFLVHEGYVIVAGVFSISILYSGFCIAFMRLKNSRN